jgi:acetyl esterase/lipase
MKGLLPNALLSFAVFNGLLCAHAEQPRFIGDVRYLGPDNPTALDLYLPPSAPDHRSHPALVFIHGNNQNKATRRAADFCGILSDSGYACASVDYRPPPQGVRDSIFDCKNAVRFLRQNAATYHIDVGRIAVVGMSMGGYLALMVGLTSTEPFFEPATPYPGVSDHVGAIIDFFGIATLPAAGFSPTTYVRAESPPVLILHGTADEKVSDSQSIALDRVLTEKKVKHRLILLEGMPHGFDLTPAPENPLPMDLRPVVLGFLAENLPSTTAPFPPPPSKMNIPGHSPVPQRAEPRSAH